ncbi:MAG: hypothetical protein WKF84_21505 [Pyrinomonadaceae bacterium]
MVARRTTAGATTLNAACFVAALLLLIATLPMLAEAAATIDEAGSSDEQQREPLIIDGTSLSDVFGLGRSVEIRGQVKHGVVALGGDVIITGRVEGDVAAVGGDVIQRESAYIGGDVIVLGGAYHHHDASPGRNPAGKTVMIAGYEQEMREMLRNPALLLQPSWSASYLGLRLLAVLFWYICSLALTSVTPDVVSRAATRLKLTSLRVALIGIVGAAVIALGVPVALRVMPVAIGALVLIMSGLLVVVAYLFGRVVIHATTGRWLQRRFFPEGKRSESVALLLGTLCWVMALSLPFVWPVVLIGLMMVSLGLALTARYRLSWKNRS